MNDKQFTQYFEKRVKTFRNRVLYPPQYAYFYVVASAIDNIKDDGFGIIYPQLENKNKLYKIILNNQEMYDIFKEDIYYKGTVLEKMERLANLDNLSLEYKELYQDIISVGEFPISK